ncbi:MAG TPA: BatA and WFA domain-containing protein [Chloroflexota bacterium]|nr:BatA and WFA domain-containing protein [Chloroflexota bacterium]
MTFVAPLALAFLAMIPVIILFYVLRAQYERREVPSTWLWRNVVRDTEGRPSWRRPVRNLLLLLQLLIILVGALALARPAILGSQQKHHIILLDASLGMQAVDVAPSRFDEAKRRASELIQAAQPSDLVTIVRVGSSVELVDTTTSQAQALASLASVQPGAGGAHARAAMQILATLSQEHRNHHNEAVFFTDGAGEEMPNVDLGNASLRFETVGVSSDNQAVVSLRVRRALDGGTRQDAFARVMNYDDSPVEVVLRSNVDGILIDTRRLNLPPRASSEVVIPLPQAAKVLEVSLEGNDALPLDNYAQLVVSNEAFDVTLVGPNPVFMERALNAVPGLRVESIRPNQYRPEAVGGLTVFDGFVPLEWPRGNALIVNPVPTNGGVIEVTGEISNVPLLRANLRSPLLDAIDLTGASVPRAAQFTVPNWASVVVDSPDGPLIVEGLTDGHRVVIFAVEPRPPEIAQRIAMPLMVANAVQSLAPSSASLATSPGGVVTLQPLPEARDVTVRDPSGKLHVFTNRGTPIPFTATETIGRYVAIHRSATGATAQQWFVVNAGDEEQSDIRPRQIVAPASPNVASGLPAGISRELWVYLAAAGLILLAAEWIVYARR